jgi:hypothetical protein
MDKTTTSDLLFGFLSIIDQFSSVLSERGSEYRQSEKGKQMEATFDKVLHELDIQQKQSIDLLISSLDGLINVLRDYNHNGEGSIQKYVKKDGTMYPHNGTNGGAKRKSTTKPQQRKK